MTADALTDSGLSTYRSLPLPTNNGRMAAEEERSLEALSPQEARTLLASATVGRVVFTLAALPAVVPVTFAVYGDAVVMRTADDTRLAAAADGGVLAFEV